MVSGIPKEILLIPESAAADPRASPREEPGLQRVLELGAAGHVSGTEWVEKVVWCGSA